MASGCSCLFALLLAQWSLGNSVIYCHESLGLICAANMVLLSCQNGIRSLYVSGMGRIGGDHRPKNQLAGERILWLYHVDSMFMRKGFTRVSKVGGSKDSMFRKPTSLNGCFGFSLFIPAFKRFKGGGLSFLRFSCTRRTSAPARCGQVPWRRRLRHGSDKWWV